MYLLRALLSLVIQKEMCRRAKRAMSMSETTTRCVGGFWSGDLLAR